MYSSKYQLRQKCSSEAHAMLEAHVFYYSLFLLTYQSDCLWRTSEFIDFRRLLTEGAFTSAKVDERLRAAIYDNG